MGERQHNKRMGTTKRARLLTKHANPNITNGEMRQNTALYAQECWQRCSYQQGRAGKGIKTDGGEGLPKRRRETTTDNIHVVAAGSAKQQQVKTCC